MDRQTLSSAQPRPVSVLIVDNDCLFLSVALDYLRAQTDLSVAGCAWGAVDGLAKSKSLHPDVVLIDLVLSEEIGIDVICNLRREFPRLGIIVLSRLEAARYAKWALAAGADVFVPKSDLMTDLVPTILALARIRSPVESSPRT